MATGQNVDAGNDPACMPGPSDTVRQLKWSPNAQNEGQFPLHLASCDWGGKTAIYEVNNQAQNRQMVEKLHQCPALSICWMPDGKQVVCGMGDNKIQLWDLATNQVKQIGQHGAPVHDVAVCTELGNTLAVSMDNNLMVWDQRGSQPLNTTPFQAKIVGLEIASPLAVVACIDNSVHTLDLRNLQGGWRRNAEASTYAFNLGISWLSVSPDGQFIGLGSYEGRAGIKKISLAPSYSYAQEYNFSAHRERGGSTYATSNSHQINWCSFVKNNSKGFITGGGDGKMEFWDFGARSRVKGLDNVRGPVTAIDINRAGFLAYAVGYDWQKGVEGIIQVQNKICYRHLGNEFMPRQTTTTTGGYRR